MRYARLRGPEGVVVGAIHGSRAVGTGGVEVELLDPETVAVAPPFETLLPVEPPEVWCAGVTYERSRDARVEESAAKDVYTLVYDAPRPELAVLGRTGRPQGLTIGNDVSSRDIEGANPLSALLERKPAHV
jgi:2-dehydro-3-deoxy-D-arabinonate dehydratase